MRWKQRENDEGPPTAFVHVCGLVGRHQGTRTPNPLRPPTKARSTWYSPKRRVKLGPANVRLW